MPASNPPSGSNIAPFISNVGEARHPFNFCCSGSDPKVWEEVARMTLSLAEKFPEVSEHFHSSRLGL